MRIGANPNKDKEFKDTIYQHQVVIPVYIPNLLDYFKDTFRIFKICIKSLIKTINNQTYITIINNGSCEFVKEYIDKQYQLGNIHEVIHTTNIGKSNAILKGIKGHYFKYITISDADVFFVKGWQEETMTIFNAYLKAGVVGIVPQFRLYADMSNNVLFDNFWSKKLQFSKVKNPEAIISFIKSIGWKDDYNKDYLKLHLTLTSKENPKVKAVVGSGHFVATYKRETIGDCIREVINEKLSSKYDRQILDAPVLKVGGWRLTTEDNYAYHMGNVYEDWMDELLLTLIDETNKKNILMKNQNDLHSSMFMYVVKNHLFRKLLSNNYFMKLFLKFKGLPKNMINNY